MNLLAIKAILGGVWGFLRAIPWQAWLVAAVLCVGWRYGEHRYDAGVADERARWEAEQADADRKAAEATAKRDEAATGVNTTTTERAHEATVETRTETATAVERASNEMQTLVVPAECNPALPVRVRDEGRAAVERARAAGSPLRAGRHP